VNKGEDLSGADRQEGAAMIQLKANESEGAVGLTARPRGHLSIQKQEGLELNPGDELLLQVQGLGTDYDLAVILTYSQEPEEDEFLIQYGDRLFVAEKAPDHI
jgi:hypothetical protein